MIALLLALLPQGQEIAGKVVGPDERGIAGAVVELAALPLAPPPPLGVRSSYRLAQASQRARVSLPKTVTDRDGEWRVMLSAQQGACAAAESIELELRVSHAGHATFRRAIGGSWLAANGVTARMEPLGKGLTVQLQGHDTAYRGFVLVERAFRVQGNRSVWLQDLVPVSGAGEARFAEPARVPGEILASSPTARAEGYRVSVFCTDLAPRVAWVPEGRHELALTRSEQGRRRILAERAELVRGAVEAVYKIAGREVPLRFDEARVPLLGGEAPIRITTERGPVELDGWDADEPLFVTKKEDAKKDEARETRESAEPAAEGPFGDLSIEVVKKDGPVYGAGVWIEDSAVKKARGDAVPFATTDAEGKALLSGLPHGAFRLLVRHPSLGTREALASVPSQETLRVELARAPAGNAEAAAGQPGTLLLDLGAATRAEIGVITPGGMLVRRVLEEATRLVRIEGLVPGPTSFWVRRGEEPAVFWAGVLAGSLDDRALAPLGIAARTWRVTVRDSQGQPVKDAFASLADRGLKDKRPFSAGLMPLVAKGEPGLFELTLAVEGPLWVQIHSGNELTDVMLQPDGVLDVRLKEPPETRPR